MDPHATGPNPYGGEYTVWLEPEDGSGPRAAVTSGRNQRLVAWGESAARLYMGDVRYRFGAAYLEFVNGTAAGSVPVPSFSAFDGREYYASLADSPDSDYLRVPVILPAAPEIRPGYEAYFQPGGGNQLLLTAVSQGVVGVNGKPFSDVAHSVIIGFAFVATPVWVDPTQDVPFGRDYFATSKQVPKMPGLQVTVTYRPYFGLA